MYLRATLAAICTLVAAGAATGAVPEHFQQRAQELLADNAELTPGEHQLNVIYFHGKDSKPVADYERRLSELLLYLQQYYGKEMARNGYGARSFGLTLRENGNVQIHHICGKLPHAAYAYGSGHNLCLAEVNAYLDAEPGRRTSQHTIVIMPTHYNEQYNDMNPGGVPFYGLGTNCFALDYAHLDIRHLGQDNTLGHLLTKWYGGLAHELGHGLNLPHNKGTAGDNAALGTALMGAGNYTFGLRPTYMTAASCNILANSELFAPRGTGTKFYTQQQQPAIQQAALKRVGDTLELRLNTSADVVAANAYVQDPPYQVNRDYDAVPFVCRMSEDEAGTHTATLSIPLAELSELSGVYTGEIAIDLLLITREGSRFRWRVPFELSKVPAGGSIDMGKPELWRGY